jgi:uncharacterized DUF497 family protein
MNEPTFEWDEAKRESNLLKHGVDFLKVQQLFDGRPLATLPGNTSQEERYASTGEIVGRMYTVVWTKRGERYRLISVGVQAVAKSERIVRYTAAEIDEMLRRGEDRTDYARLDAMTDEELEASIDREDEGEFDHTRAFAGLPPVKVQVTLHLDLDILRWFKSRSGDDESMINDVLRSYVEAQKHADSAAQPQPTAEASSRR